ncbi:hypothetical protein B7494_g7461 [Chlorociboria aeruginascens]|nr:hypothetical protein B7494_g7461 [Chlorociboria aeruginascens]
MSETRTDKITRPRPSLSCVVCRRRKVRCEREQPSCSNCVKVNEHCQYDNNLKHRQRLKGKPAPMPHVPEPEMPRPELTPPVTASEYSWSAWGNGESVGLGDPRYPGPGKAASSNDLLPAAGASDTSSAQFSGGATHRPSASPASYRTPSANAGSAPANQQRPGKENHPSPKKLQQGSATEGSEDVIRVNSPKPASSTGSTSSRKRRRSPIDLSEQNDPPRSERGTREGSSVPDATRTKGYLSIQGGQMHYVGSAFWGFAKGHELLCELLLLDDDNSKTTHTPRAHIDSLGLANMLKTLPSKGVCDIFLYSFMIGVRPILPLVRVPGFLGDYNDYWTWYATTTSSEIALPSAKLLADPTWLCLLNSVIYCGAVTAAPSIWKADILQDVDKEYLISQCRTSYLTSLNLCQHLRHPTCNTLVASLLAHQCSTQERDDIQDGEFVSTAMRLAREMGMHRDGSILGLDPSDSEMRRRIWWHIVVLDVQASIRNGSPTLGTSSPSQHDVQMVNHCRDEDLEREEKVEIVPNKQTPSISMLFAAGIYETARFEHDLVSHLNGIQGLSQVQFDEFLKSMRILHIQIDNLINRIPAQGIPEKGLIPSRIANAIPLVHEKLYSDTSSEPTVFMSWARIMLTMAKAGTTLLLQTALLDSVDIGGKEIDKVWSSIVQISITYLRHYLQVIQVPSFAPYTWYLLNCQTPLKCVFLIFTFLHNHPNSTQGDLARYFADEVLETFTGEEDPSKDTAGKVSSYKSPIKTDGETRASWEKIRAIRDKLDIPHALVPPQPKQCVPSDCIQIARNIFSPPTSIPDLDLTNSLPLHSLTSSKTPSSIHLSTTFSASLPESRDEFDDNFTSNQVLDISELMAWSASLTDDPNAFYSYGQDIAADTLYALPPLTTDFPDKFDALSNWQMGVLPSDMNAKANGRVGDRKNVSAGSVTGDWSSRQSVADEGRVSNLLNSMMET